jgi:hypothetical protein
MDPREGPEHGVILDAYVSGQAHVVGHDDVAADVAVVRDVGADHEQVVVADGG